LKFIQELNNERTNLSYYPVHPAHPVKKEKKPSYNPVYLVHPVKKKKKLTCHPDSKRTRFFIVD